MLSCGASRCSGNCSIRVIHCTLEEVSEVCCLVVSVCQSALTICHIHCTLEEVSEVCCLVVPPGVQGTVPLGSYTVHWKR